MEFLQQFLKRPRRLWLRRVNFQVHLWAGIILALYVAVIGLTGSILVFGAELDKLVNPNPWPGITRTEPTADIALVIDRLRLTYPGTHIVSVTAPAAFQPVFIAVLQPRTRLTVACHPVTGQVLGAVPLRKSRLEWLYDLHENLLAGRVGRKVNGAAAAFLLLLAGTGLFNWWPGAQNVRRALTVDFGRQWKRINFDLHSAVGFWALMFITLWAATGIYFAWPDKVLALVSRWSPPVNSRPPAITISPEWNMVKLDFHSMLTKSRSLETGARLKSIVFPVNRRSPLEIVMSRSPAIGRDYEDTVYFNPYNGRYISIWRYGVNRSLGDWILWLQIPLHFGTHWGLGIKCLWAAIGLTLPVLSVTGLVMYWNRWLGKKWPANLRFWSQA